MENNVSVNVAKCPVDHATWSKTASISDTPTLSDMAKTPIERDASGVWHVYGFSEARAILRSNETKQAGFNAEQVEQVSGFLKPSILYQEGATHHEQRRQTARFFAPKTVSGNYRQFMEKLADELISILQQTKKADLSDVSFQLAIGVAAQIVGLTNSDARMHKRIEEFFSHPARVDLPRWHPKNILLPLFAMRDQLKFYLHDVRPAIKERRKSPKDDLISHMLSQKARNRDIHIECLTYAAAGMVTTREFISVAAWHMLEHPDLRSRYLAAPEAERYLILEEILRLEPIIGHLWRKATGDITIESNGTPVVIAAGDLIHLHTYAINADPVVVTENQHTICPGRELQAERVQASLLSFGDGSHKCAGLYVAIQESDIFLHRLLALDLRFQSPDLRWNGVSSGYEIRKFLVTLP